MWEMGKIFCCWVGFSPIYRVSPKGLEEGEGQSIPGWATRKMKEGGTFGKIGDTWGHNSEKLFCWTLLCI